MDTMYTKQVKEIISFTQKRIDRDASYKIEIEFINGKFSSVIIDSGLSQRAYFNDQDIFTRIASVIQNYKEGEING